MAPTYFASPEVAALSDFPAGAVYVVASRANADNAYVLLDTRPNGPAYPYGIAFKREAGEWIEGASNNAGGWFADGDLGLGMLAFWDEDAPAGADLVRIDFGSDIHEEPVTEGVFLSVWWRVPSPERISRVSSPSEWRVAGLKLGDTATLTLVAGHERAG